MRRFLHAFLLIAALAGSPARAQVITLAAPGPKIGIAVGAAGAGISLVSFTLGTQAIGTPIPQTGAAIPIEATFFRAAAGASPTITLTAAPAATSPSGLVSGANIVPWTEISWTVAGQIQRRVTILAAPAAGTFTGAAGQTLMQFTCTRANRNCYLQANYTFSYLNSTVVASGTYTGRIVYTVSAI